MMEKSRVKPINVISEQINLFLKERKLKQNLKPNVKMMKMNFGDK